VAPVELLVVYRLLDDVVRVVVVEVVVEVVTVEVVVVDVVVEDEPEVLTK
jgi:hypothetical protein